VQTTVRLIICRDKRGSGDDDSDSTENTVIIETGGNKYIIFKQKII